MHSSSQKLKIMKNFFYGLVLLFLSYGLAQANYSNMIIFGDSQSDIGNMPESGNLVDPNIPVLHYYHGVPYNLYVPVSNPVAANNDAIFARLLNFPALPPQPLIAQKFSHEGRSINWSQYLFAALNTSGKLQSPSLLPWLSIYQHPELFASHTSVNYAFSGALSIDHCSDEDYYILDDSFCNAQQVSVNALKYRADPNNDTLRNELIIPDTRKQIDFFAEDLQAGRVQVDPQTLYVIWTGANDLAVIFHYLLEGDVSFFVHNLDTTISQQTVLAVQHLYQLGARNIVVIGQQNLGLTPIASILTDMNGHFYTRYLNAYTLNLLVLDYNIHLSRRLVTLQKQYPDLNLQYLALQSFYNHFSLIPGQVYFYTIGLACQDASDTTFSQVTQGQLVHCKNYLYWNGSHMTDEANQLLAKKLFEQI